jgi:hypothetical protein
MHSSETLTFRRKYEGRLEAAEMRFLRCHRIYSLGQGTEWQNKVTARKVEVGQIIHENKNWLKCIQTRPSERVPKQCFYYQPIRRSDPGRSRRRWLNNLMFKNRTS